MGCLARCWDVARGLLDHRLCGLVENRIERGPGAVASLSVVLSGLALALFLLNLLRIGPARRLADGAIRNEGIESHKRGESAIDPLTGREIPPPAG